MVQSLHQNVKPLKDRTLRDHPDTLCVKVQRSYVEVS